MLKEKIFSLANIGGAFYLGTLSDYTAFSLGNRDILLVDITVFVVYRQWRKTHQADSTPPL